VDESESLSLLFFFPSDFFMLVTSGRDSSSEDKALQIASFAGGEKVKCDAEVPSSRYLIFDAKGCLNLFEFDNKLPASFSSTWLCPETPCGKMELCLLKQSWKVLVTSCDKEVIIPSSIL
jgi:hypothetical protein